MKLPNNIREKIGFFILKRKIKRSKRQTEFNNFNSAKSMGIVFDASDKESYVVSKAYIRKLEERNIDVTALGFVESTDNIEELPYHKSIRYYTFEDFDNFGRPASTTVRTYIENTFHLFLDFSGSQALPVQYVIATSKAKMKIGRKIGMPQYYDLTLQMPKDSDLKDFINQVEHYLSTIRKKEVS